MIIIQNRKLLIPNEDRFLGTDYDHNSGIRQFKLDRYTQTETDLAGLTPKLDLQYEDGTLDTADLSKEVEDDRIILTLVLSSSIMAHTGTVLMNLRMTDSGGMVKWASFMGAFYIDGSISTPSKVSSSLTELEQVEARANEALERLTAAVNAAIASAGEAETEAETAAANAEAVTAEVQRLLETGAFIGPQGPKGDPGQSITGPQGPQGEKGEKGEKGDRGDSGILIKVEGTYAMYVEENGDLYVEYTEGTAVPTFEYDPETGDLYEVTET